MGNIVESLYRLAEANSLSGEEYLLGDEIKNYIDSKIRDGKSPNKNDHLCNKASDAVVEYLESKGINGAESFSNFLLSSDKDSLETDSFIVSSPNDHTVVKYDGKYYDFEFDQFIDKAPSFKGIRPVVFEKENDLYVATSPSGEKIYMRK